MSDREEILVCTTERVHGRDIKSIVGIAFGSSRVIGERAGKWTVNDGNKSWPWAEDPQHYESLFRMAESELRSCAMGMGADAVIGMRAQVERDQNGRPGIHLTGTAVTLAGQQTENTPTNVPGPLKEESTDVDHSLPRGRISIAFEGKRGEWGPMEAVERDNAQPIGTDDAASALALANRLGIASDRAMSLVRGGLRTVSDVASSTPGDLARICNLNPTQARILHDSARKASEEDAVCR